MKLACVDLCKWDYDVDTPFERPHGGSQQASCYLTIELARRGHHVSLFSRSSRPGLMRGVHCEGFDGAVFLNPPVTLGPEIRRTVSAPLVLWTQHAQDQRALAELVDPEVRRVRDEVVCVSDWQRATLIATFGLDEQRVAVRRNAIGPAFEGMFSDAAEPERAKRDPLRVTCTSTPFGGLDVMLHCFGDFARAVPGARLEVYSSRAGC